MEAFADHFAVRDAIRLNTRVTNVQPVSNPSLESTARLPGCPKSCTKWEVTTELVSQAGRGGSTVSACTAVYDAVMICNGHYSAPRTPDVPGLDTYPFACEHSHSYRRPEAYAGQRVLIVGAHASGASVSASLRSHASRQRVQRINWCGHADLISH